MAKIKVTATILRQKDKELYLFKINSTLLNKISYVTPRSDENPEELQRVLKTSRAKEIGEWLKDENSLLPNSIVVDFNERVTIEETGEKDKVTIKIPNPNDTDDHKVAYILDGQHRVKGFEYSDGLEFDLAVIATHNISSDVRGKMFIDINSKQEKVDEKLLLDIRDGIGDFEQDEHSVYAVLKKLDKEKDSPFQGKIQFLPEQKNKWIKNTSFFVLLKPHIGNGGILYNKTTAQQVEILKSYFNAFKELYSEEWENQKEYIITKTQGIDLMCGVFREFKNRCDLYEGKIYNKKTFKNQIKLLIGKSINIKLKNKENIKIPLDWSKNGIGHFSAKQWMSEIKKEIINILNI